MVTGHLFEQNTYLNKTLNLSKKIVKTYATRMQIEESFRDVKKKG
jgi:hypothetical protein